MPLCFWSPLTSGYCVSFVCRSERSEGSVSLARLAASGRRIAPLRLRFLASLGTTPSPLSVQQGPHVLEQFVRAHGAVTLLRDQPVYHLINPAQLLLVRRLGGRRDLHHVAQVRKQLLLDRLAQPLV